LRGRAELYLLQMIMNLRGKKDRGHENAFSIKIKREKTQTKNDGPDGLQEYDPDIFCPNQRCCLSYQDLLSVHHRSFFPGYNQCHTDLPSVHIHAQPYSHHLALPG
jgi:hypothetical protein